MEPATERGHIGANMSYKVWYEIPETSLPKINLFL
jgi:hypothetical protein